LTPSSHHPLAVFSAQMTFWRGTGSLPREYSVIPSSQEPRSCRRRPNTRAAPPALGGSFCQPGNVNPVAAANWSWSGVGAAIDFPVVLSHTLQRREGPAAIRCHGDCHIVNGAGIHAAPDHHHFTVRSKGHCWPAARTYLAGHPNVLSKACTFVRGSREIGGIVSLAVESTTIAAIAATIVHAHADLVTL
jgi:hypothetical protein